MNFHPFQALRLARRDESGDLLIAACGPALYTVQTGSNAAEPGIVWRWPTAQPVPSAEADSEPQQKKQRLSAVAADVADFTDLCVAPDHKHIVAVSGSEKCVMVFEICDNGGLRQLSNRVMPKRPCALQVTSDNKHIICGDKFGDVYALPLLVPKNTPTNGTHGVADSHTAVSKAYEPAATTLTVHTKRNRRALEEQLRSRGKQVTTKEALNFEHTLLLGHVSLLTDLQLATALVNGQFRPFVITCDRDEHIRVSRGLPQTHVIERFCLGHKEFVSRILCIPGSTLLVSGGGDSWLGVWDWTTGELLVKKDLTGLTKSFDTKSIAVSHLWLARTTTGEIALLVKAEGIAALAAILVDALTDAKAKIHTCSTAEVLDLVETGYGRLVVSMDAEPRLQEYSLGVEAGQCILRNVSGGRAEALSGLNAVSMPRPSADRLQSCSRSVEKLRKSEAEADGE